MTKNKMTREEALSKGHAVLVRQKGHVGKIKVVEGKALIIEQDFAKK